jgi:ubiquinol oxidase
MEDDDGWIHTLLDEAENERMHLMTFVCIAEPTWIERLIILIAQGVFFNGFFLLYLISPRTAHRVVGYFEEEAIYSYTEYLAEIDRGITPNVPAPAIAIEYWKLAPDARLRDVVVVVRADELHHRDVNHEFADELSA